MPIESATYISQLNSSYPLGTDVKSQGDDHLRLIKSCLLNSFPGLSSIIFAVGSETQGNTVNDYNVNISATLSSYPNAMIVAFTATHANNGSANININNLGNIPMYNSFMKNLHTGAISNNQLCIVFVSQSYAVLLNSAHLGDIEHITYPNETQNNKIASTLFVHNAIANYLSQTDTQWINPIYKYSLQTIFNIL